MHLNPSLKFRYQTVEKQKKTFLERIDNKKFISNRRLILIDRMKQFRESAMYQKPYAVLDVDEQTVMTCNINQMLKKVYHVALEQRRNVAASKLQSYIRRRQKRIALETYLGALILIQRTYRKRLLRRDFYVRKEHLQAAPMVQKYMRGYLAYKQYTIPIHKLRLVRQFDGFKEEYGGLRAYIRESLQIKLAYLHRRVHRKKKR